MRSNRQETNETLVWMADAICCLRFNQQIAFAAMILFLSIINDYT